MGSNVKDVESDIGENEVVSEPWHVFDVEKCGNLLNSDSKAGLSKDEAAKRFEINGPNELSEKKKVTIWERIWRQISNVLVVILIIVAIVSAIKAATSSGDDAVTGWIEVVLIVGVIVLNTWIGIKQEGDAEKSANALKAMLSADALVVRNGEKLTVPAREVVKGDLVVLGTGDKIPADVRLVKVSNFSCQEAALTGESVPVDKVTETINAENPSSVPLGDRKNMAFSATLVTQGEAYGFVVNCGDDTEIGQINSLVNNAETKKTNVERQIDTVSKWIAVFVLCVALVTFFVAMYGGPHMEWSDALSTALVTSVAMIPEGLAAIVTLTYAYAVSQMAKENAIVRVLPAVETLGSVTVICSDKTGTLTKNEMTLVGFVTSNGRYKFDVESKERTPDNFVREDAFMSHTPDAPGNDDTKEVAKPEDVWVSPTPDYPFKNGQSPDITFLQRVLAGGVLCSHALPGETRDKDIGNPTEIAIVRATHLSNIDFMGMRNNQPIINQIPFNSEYKFMATFHKPLQDIDLMTEGMVMHVKGAPDRLIARSSHQYKDGIVSPDNIEPIDRDYWLKQAANLSSHGLRCLALCRTVVPDNTCDADSKITADFILSRQEPFLTICGICAIMDPPRPECVEAIKEAHGAGVRVAMITGDHKDTAIAIGGMLGLISKKYSSGITGPEMDEMSDEELRRAVLKYNIFARASPENKIRIVKALQAEGQCASMTGDGVNDAPALKAADMGVAMGKEGTDVAREASEMILADDNFATIVVAVRLGRSVWNNLRKILLFNTPVNNSQGLTVLCGIIGGLENSPLTPIQVLYCNLICAVTLGMVLAIEPAEDGIMSEPPRRPGKRLIGRFLLLRIAIGTIVLTGCSIGTVFWLRSWNDYLTGSSIAEICNSCNCTVGICNTGNVATGCIYTYSADQSSSNWNCGNLPTDTLTTIQDNCNAGTSETCNYGKADYEPYNWNEQRAQASNSLTFGAISIMLSARFAYQSSLHPRLFRGNIWAWYAAGITALLQVAITYIPGLNDLVFQMEGMDGPQWGLVVFSMGVVFLVMELEKAIRRNLKSKGVDTDDQLQDDLFDEKVSIQPTQPFVPARIHSSGTLHSTLLKR